MSSEFFDVLNCQEAKNSHMELLKQLEGAFLRIAEYLITRESITFDEVMTLLCKDGIRGELNHDNNNYISALYLILCIVSWQTMLFKPGASIICISRSTMSKAATEAMRICV